MRAIKREATPWLGDVHSGARVDDDAVACSRCFDAAFDWGFFRMAGLERVLRDGYRDIGLKIEQHPSNAAVRPALQGSRLCEASKALLHSVSDRSSAVKPLGRGIPTVTGSATRAETSLRGN